MQQKWEPDPIFFVGLKVDLPFFGGLWNIVVLHLNKFQTAKFGSTNQ